MKVVFVTRGYPSDKDPMSGNYEAVQAKALAKKGIDVSVLCINARSLIHLFEKTKIEQFDDEGVHVYQCRPTLPLIPKIWMHSYWRLNDWILMRAFYRLFQEYCEEKGEPDIIHAHIITPAYQFKYVIDRHDIPLIITEHWSKMNDPSITSNKYRQWAKMYFKAKKVIAVSKQLSSSLKEKYGVDSVVINNMVSDTFFSSKNNMHKKNGYKFIAVGSLLPIKGFDLLIEAFSKCHFDQDVCLDIVGGGQEMNNLQKMIDKCGLRKQIKLHGLKQAEEVCGLMTEADCYVMSSHAETFGIVCIEAMAKGLPVIATRCGGPEDFINEHNGLLIPVNDVEALAGAMQDIYKNAHRYNHEAIRDYCRRNFSESAIADQILAVYKEVIKNNN